MVPVVNLLLSRFFGYLSFSVWLVVFIPQLYLNMVNRSADSLSLGLLVFWTFGDLCYLIGSVCQGVLFTTLLLSVYFILLDLVTLGQYYHYNLSGTVKGAASRSALIGKPDGICPAIARETTPLLAGQPDPTITLVEVEAGGLSPLMAKPPSRNRELFRTLGTLAVLACLCMLVAMFNVGFFSLGLGRPAPNSNGGNAFLSDRHDDSHFHPFAQLCTWIAVVFYLGSRMFQIAKNYTTQTCEGLSVAMFFLCIVGNSSFAASVLVYSVEPHYIFINLPWIATGTGTILLDAIIMGQCFYYRDRAPERPSVIVGPLG
ncbi:putative vacuolar membrane transporter for cationic amino acids [Tieghemiomyces parasiticus]|uniref:Vacuolar membrane transporter for cationic amino acids n=1 Tax=Tieghemiomyces parasiticus TaxID=78921 RepID=A0A9W8DMU1_9FUNG|nr:putative vacuolar membrane transporter for cationic amino acids [Tieghemiomyces parasiticus]